MPSNSKVKRAILENVPASSRLIYELGSGWGGLAFALGKKFPQATVIAYEISFVPWFYSLILKRVLYKKNVHIHRKNFFNGDVLRADCFVCYLYPKAMEKLQKKFDGEWKGDYTVVSNAFAIPGWKAVKEDKVKDLWRSKIYIYKK